MNDDRLRIYLNDHLALLVGEIELANRCWSSNKDSTLGDFLKTLEGDLKKQRQIASGVLKKVGGKQSSHGLHSQTEFTRRPIDFPSR
jgi:hypothetical protein